MKNKVFIYILAAFVLLIVGFWGYQIYEAQIEAKARQILDKSGMNFYKGSLEEALQKAKKEERMLMINFYAAWCSSCRKMKTETFSNVRVYTFYKSHFINIALNIEKEGKSLAEKYQVEAFPAMVFVDANGNVLQKVIGFKNVDDFLNIGKKLSKSQLSQ
ncbi:MAG: hypothetical protein Fur0027_01820 [Raineya sp.]